MYGENRCEIRVILVSFTCADPLSVLFLSPVIMTLFFPLIDMRRGNTFTKGFLCPVFRQMGESKDLFYICCFLIAFSSKQSYAKVACFGGIF